MVMKFFLCAFLLIPAVLFPLACGSGSSNSSSSPSSPGGSGSNTATVTNTSTSIITSTWTVTNTATKTQTTTATNTATSTYTQTITNTPSMTPTKTWTPCLTPEVFGDTNTTGSASNPSSGVLYFSNFTSPAFAGNLRDIRVYMATSATNIQVGLFTTSSGKPGTAVAVSPATPVDTGGSLQWVYFYFPSTPALSASTAYTLCVLYPSGSNAPGIETHLGGTNFNQALSSDLTGTISSYAGPFSNEVEIAADYCH